LPDLIAERQSTKKLRIWSAACSSGEEPYSIAMSLRTLIPNVDEWNLYIVGTDIDRSILDKAGRATYGEWSFRQVPEEFDAFFEHTDGARAVVPEVRSMVQFHQQNLVDAPSWINDSIRFGKMDIIFCRNVLIYFDEETTQKVIDALYDCLNPGGWLVVGHADPSQERFAKFATHTFPQTIIYQRPGAGVEAGFANQVRPAAQSTVNLADIQSLAKHSPNEAIARLLAASEEPDPASQRTILLARLLASRRRLPEAQDQAAKAVQLASLSAEAYYVQGTILREMGRADQALDVFRRAVFLDKEFVLAKVQLAECLNDLGQHDRARRELQAAAEMVESKPTSGVVYGDPELSVGRLREMIGSKLRLLSSSNETN
jgi:chemotaxis protein methyltransferase CheR